MRRAMRWIDPIRSRVCEEGEELHATLLAGVATAISSSWPRTEEADLRRSCLAT
jgi:hypothetical protein